jgi:hypothetical protein
LLPTYAHPSLNGNNLHVDSPTSSEKVIDWNDIPNTYLNLNSVPCPLAKKLKKSYDCTWKFQFDVQIIHIWIHS